MSLEGESGSLGKVGSSAARQLSPAHNAVMNMRLMMILFLPNAGDHAVAAKNYDLKVTADRRLACIAWLGIVCHVTGIGQACYATHGQYPA